MERVQLGQEADEVLKAAAKPINRPGHDHIELALIGVPDESIERRPLVPALGARNTMILVNVNDLTAHPISHLAKFALLISRRLIRGRNPEIKNSSFHRIPLNDSKMAAGKRLAEPAQNTQTEAARR